MVMSIGWNPFYKNTVRSVVGSSPIFLFSLLLSFPFLPTSLQSIPLKYIIFFKNFFSIPNFQISPPPCSSPQEVHILPPNPFIHDFYGAHLNLMILGHIRPERDYDSTEALVRDIKIDIEVAKASSAREAYRGFREEDWLLEFPPTMTAMTTTTEGEGEKR